MIMPALTLCVAGLFISAAFVRDPDRWDVPANYKDMINPVKADTVSINNGQVLYKKHCLSCHGKTGLGDGVKARQLEEHPGDMSSSAYQRQTDGEHFYKTRFGREEMPAYERILSDNEIWDIVNYMRTFKK
jgi:mono/diheme cytochrome c family protein